MHDSDGNLIPDEHEYEYDEEGNIIELNSDTDFDTSDDLRDR
jgi:YD repeat-containing protein